VEFAKPKLMPEYNCRSVTNNLLAAKEWRFSRL